jgi:hypothetical protein
MPHRGQRPCELDHSPVEARIRHNRDGILFCATGGRLNEASALPFRPLHRLPQLLYRGIEAYLGTLQSHRYTRQG